MRSPAPLALALCVPSERPAYYVRNAVSFQRATSVVVTRKILPRGSLGRVDGREGGSARVTDIIRPILLRILFQTTYFELCKKKKVVSVELLQKYLY